jgi:hypothetical protein
MSKLQNLLESANPYKSLQSDAERLAKKWQSTGLLEGIKTEVEKNNMAMILESQAKQLVIENNQTTFGGANFNTGPGEQWAGIALPMVRKIFGQIAAKEFVSVQPMNLPSGLVFYLDFQYGNNVKPFAAGSSLYGDRGGNNPFGNTNTGGFYGAGRFAYSINQTSSAGITTTITSASMADINYDSNFSASEAAGTIKKVSLATSNLVDFDPLAIRGFVAVSASIDEGELLQAFTKINGSNIEFFFTGSTAAISNTAGWSVYYTKLTKDNARGDFEDGSPYAIPNAATPGGEDSIVIPELNVKLQSEAIVAKTRKLKTVWTPEFAQDLNAYHSLDAEAELTSIMSEHVSLEIDLEILEMLINAASAGTEYWTAQNNGVFNGTGFDFPSTTNNTGFFNTQGQWFQTLGTKLQKLSNIIHQKTLRGGANFMICSPQVGTIIESIPGYTSNSDGDVTKAQYAFGVQKAGQLNSRYTVYKNPYMTENLILLGYRGSQFLEAGAVFAPYIPLIMTPLVYDPDTFTPRKGLLTRYAKKVIRPEFYAKVYVSGINTL